MEEKIDEGKMKEKPYWTFSQIKVEKRGGTTLKNGWVYFHDARGKPADYRDSPSHVVGYGYVELKSIDKIDGLEGKLFGIEKKARFFGDRDLESIHSCEFPKAAYIMVETSEDMLIKRLKELLNPIRKKEIELRRNGDYFVIEREEG